MKYLEQLVKENGHKLIQSKNGVYPVIQGHKYISTFNYSIKYGGTFDSFKYYNNFIIDITENKGDNKK